MWPQYRHVPPATSRLLAALFVLALSLAGCGGGSSGEGGSADDDGDSESQTAEDTLDKLNEEGIVRIGMANQPPFQGVDMGGEPIGVGTEILARIVEEMGLQPEWVVATYDALIPGLQSGRWDIAHLLRINPARCEEVAFSEPVEAAAYALAVPTGNPNGLTTVADVAADDDMELGMITGASAIDHAMNAGVPDSRIQRYPDTRSVLDALVSDRVDAVLASSAAIFELRENESDFDIGPPVPEVTTESAAFAFRLDDERLVAEVNEHLQALKDGSEFDQILQKYGLPPEIPRRQSTERLCEGIID